MSLPRRRVKWRSVGAPLACALVLLIATCAALAAPGMSQAFAPAATGSGSSAPSGPRGSEGLAPQALQQAELSDPAAATNDRFGSAVALAAGTALIGASGTTVNGQPEAGAAYIFSGSGTSWSQQAALVPSDPAAINELFGASVALFGDTAVVGAPWKTVGGQSDAGAAYVFTGSGTSWSQQDELTGSGALQFGDAVAISGDTVLVGADEQSNGYQMKAGAVYVFTRSGTTWTQEAELTDPGPMDGDEFGCSVAISGDTALIGADSAARDGIGGTVYVFTRSGTTWTQEAVLNDPDSAYDYFGCSVALSGGTALIGAWGETVDGQNQAGAAYVFTGAGASWSQQAELIDPDAAEYDSFGDTVALDGTTALVAAPWKSVGGASGVGAAYTYTGSGTNWSPQRELVPSDATANEHFGDSGAVSGETALIGAPYLNTSTASVTGTAYVDGLVSPPSVSFKASKRSVKVGSKVTLSGLVRNHVAGCRSVFIERKVNGRLARLKTATCSATGAFKWTWRTAKTGKWVLVVIYKAGATKYSSKSVTVAVHR